MSYYGKVKETCQKLVEDPELLINMKKANEEYYRKYLKPDSLIANTLKIIDDSCNSAQLQEAAKP